jgi:hypothetical protein
VVRVVHLNSELGANLELLSHTINQVLIPHPAGLLGPVQILN